MSFYEFEEKKPLVDQDAFIHPEAVIIGDVKIESGCYVGAGAVLRGDFGSIIIGKGSNVQENCVLHTDINKTLILHPETHIGHGSILHSCEICSYVQIGMGSIIMDEVKVNSYCLIGAGTFIPLRKEIPEKSVVIGSPAKVTKKITQEQLEKMAKGRAAYQELAKRCLKSLRQILF
jgi:phenylacetic acid degradation protein